MVQKLRTLAVLTPVVLLACGCGDTEVSPAAVSTAPPSEQQANFRLSAEPAGTRGVIEVRKQARDGEEVVVTGRIAGSHEPLVKGRAAFTIVDMSLEPCECEEPWVYCCTPKEELLAGMVLIKFVDGQGKTIAQDARQLLGVKEWNTVVVRGHAQRDADGNLTAVIAKGLFVKP